jgi:hypothetical protein
MILPSKHISQEKALLTIGAKLLEHLEKPKTISSIWEYFHQLESSNDIFIISFDWFVLVIDFLYLIDAIEMHEGLLQKKAKI